MAAPYEIQSVKGPREWSGNFGPMHSFVLTVDGEDKPVHINQKPESPAPRVGDTVWLEVSPHDRFDDALKGKKVQPPDGEQGSWLSAVQGAGNGARPVGEDSARSAAITRMAAQKVAIEGAVAAIQLGIEGAPRNRDEFWGIVDAHTDHFAQDADAARARGLA